MVIAYIFPSDLVETKIISSPRVIDRAFGTSSVNTLIWKPSGRSISGISNAEIFNTMNIDNKEKRVFICLIVTDNIL